jgi:hypothetical protein
MLVDTRDPRYHDGEEGDGGLHLPPLPWRALLRLVATVAAFVAAASVGGFGGYLILVGTLIGVCLSFSGGDPGPPSWRGMKDYRQ